jgi:hypothetical protein
LGKSYECKKCSALRNFNLYNRKKTVKPYKISVEEYDKLYELQNGKCKVCGGINNSGRRLSIDHDHKTGKIRGLLCIKCNSAIAQVNDNINLLLKLAIYLEEFK